jgi:colanic acid biosynthesis glycosyl transferase WcaI
LPASPLMAREPMGGSPVHTVSRHLVFVCLVFHPDTSASSILFTDLFRRLADSDMAVTVLCGFPAKERDLDLRGVPREETVGAVRIVRCGLRIDGKRNLAFRTLGYGSFLAHAAWKLLKMGPRVQVVGGTDPPFVSVALWLLSLTRRVRYEEILLDVYPDGLTALGRLDPTSRLVRIWRELNRRSYLGAGRITVIGRDMVTLLIHRYGIDPERVAYVPHWGSAEVDCSEQGATGLLRERLGLGAKFVVQYSGNMGLWHDIETLVRAVALLQDDPSIHFLFIGKGMRRQGAETLFRNLGLANGTWVDFLPREQLADGLASCDAALISLREGLEGVAVPSKLYGILASGKAVLAQVPRESEVAYTVTEEQCGYVIEPGDAAGLAAAIRLLASQPDLCAAMGRRGREAYRRKYTIDQAVDAFRALWSLTDAVTPSSDSL